MNRNKLTFQTADLVGGVSGLALYLLLAASLCAQSSLPSEPRLLTSTSVLPIQAVSHPRPIGYGAGESGNLPPPSWLDYWFATLSASYQFSDERSRVGGGSLDSDSVLVDLSVTNDDLRGDGHPYYTTIDLAYAYSYTSGSLPIGASQFGNQNECAVSILQPLEPIIDAIRPNDSGRWQPPYVWHGHDPAYQFSAIVVADYANSNIRVEGLGSHNSAWALTGNTLLDFQGAKFLEDDYFKLFFECSSGVQCSRLSIDTLNGKSRSRSTGVEVTYRNIASVNFSPFKRWGLFLAAEWDAPLDSIPVRGAPPYYANTVVFTAGITYNYNPGSHTSQKLTIKDRLFDYHRWSLGLFYSYIAFDPFTETNALQVRLSYSF